MSCAQAVAVRRDQRALAGHHGRRDGVVPVGQNASDRVLQALRAWKASWTEIEVARIAGLDPRITFRERGRGDIEGTPPDLDLRFAVAGSRLRLVQSLQRPVMPLVQAPRTVDGNPHPIHLLQRGPQRLNARRSTDVKAMSKSNPSRLSNWPAARASAIPCSVRPTSVHPEKRFSRFQVDSPWRRRTSFLMTRAPGTHRDRRSAHPIRALPRSAGGGCTSPPGPSGTAIPS